MNAAHKENELILVTNENFDERAYLASNPDVAQAVREGGIESGKKHFELFGRKEKRKMRVGHLSNDFPKSRIAHILFALVKKVKDSFGNLPLIGSECDFDTNESHTDDFHEKRKRIVQEYIGGAGIEIGALHEPAPVPAGVTVQYVDRLSVEHLRQQYPELDNLPLVAVDIIANGETLEPIANCSQDFVIANSFLEHCQSPLLAIENMLRVLKQNGILYMAIPDKRFTFDIDRPVTPYHHLVQDYMKGSEISRKQHFEEWVKLIGKATDEKEIKSYVDHLMSIDYSIHFHVWTQIEMIELVLTLRKQLEFEVELICRNINEMIFVLRKG